MTSDMKPVPRAPWRNQFLEHISKMPSPEFVLSTIEPSDPDFGNAPRARYCIFRGMWTHLTPNDKNPAEKNPSAYESDCITFTTDIRMEKLSQIFRSGSADIPVYREEIEKSGGGGPVEAVWWVKDEGVSTQWRVRGDAYALAPGCESKVDGQFHMVAKAALLQWMRVVDESKTSEWSWEREITAHFGNLAPGMRGSFTHPPPGVPVTNTSEEPDKTLGQGCDDLNDRTARKNFRVVVIRPFRVESTDLSDPKTSRRQLYTYDRDCSVWKHETLWP